MSCTRHSGPYNDSIPSANLDHLQFFRCFSYGGQRPEEHVDDCHSRVLDPNYLRRVRRLFEGELVSVRSRDDNCLSSMYPSRHLIRVTRYGFVPPTLE